jgi:hypothetical protein
VIDNLAEQASVPEELENCVDLNFVNLQTASAGLS